MIRTMVCILFLVITEFIDASIFLVVKSSVEVYM